MKLPLQIVFRGLEPLPAIESIVRDKAHKLEQLCSEIMSCRVDIEQLEKHKTQGRPYAVRIHLKLPGHELSADRVRDEDVHVALRDAFDDMKRQIIDTVRLLQRQEKQHAAPLRGSVVRLADEGAYGFILGSDGNEYYFSRENMAGTPFEHIQVGTQVQFIAEPAAEGMQAKRVSVGKHNFS